MQAETPYPSTGGKCMLRWSLARKLTFAPISGPEKNEGMVYSPHGIDRDGDFLRDDYIHYEAELLA